MNWQRIFAFPKPDLPFAREDANQFLPWIIGFMVFLTTLMLAGGISLNGAIAKGRANYANSITVQVPYSTENMSQKVYEVADTLRKNPGIKNVRIVRMEEVKDMLAPWLGSGEVLEMLPIPALIEARILPEGSDKRPSLDVVRAELNNITPGIELDDNKSWIQKFTAFTRSIQAVAFILAGLMVACTACVIVLAARTSLKLHYRTVELIHSMGARDEYLARQFKYNAALLTLRGALTGTLIAALLYLSISLMASTIDAPIFPSMQIGLAHYLMFLLVPLSTMLVAVLAARGAVLRFLKTMP